MKQDINGLDKPSKVADIAKSDGETASINPIKQSIHSKIQPTAINLSQTGPMSAVIVADHDTSSNPQRPRMKKKKKSRGNNDNQSIQSE